MVRLVSMAIEITLRLAIELAMQKAKEMILDRQNKKLIEQGNIMKKNSKIQAVSSAL